MSFVYPFHYAKRRTHIRVEEQAPRNDYHVLIETKYVRYIVEE